MKKTLLTAMILAFCTAGIANAQAQPQSGFGPQQGAGPGARLVEELGLDEYQAAEIAAIFEEARALHQQEREKSLETQAAIKAETHVAVMALLTEEQQLRFEELQQLREERWSNGQSRGHGKRGGPGDGSCTGSGTGGPGGGTGGSGNGSGNCDGSGDCSG